jgi:hypothetical protein
MEKLCFVRELDRKRVFIENPAFAEKLLLKYFAPRFFQGETPRTIYFCNFVIIGFEPVLKENKKTSGLKTNHINLMIIMAG